MYGKRHRLSIAESAIIANHVILSYLLEAAIRLGSMFDLLLFSVLWSLVEVNSQTFPYVTFNGQTLANHSYVDLSLVGDDNSGSSSVQCHTNLGTCCTSGQGSHRGDWYFPDGNRLQFNGDIHEARGNQRVDLRRSNSATSPVGIYRCDIPTIAVHDDSDTSVRDTVYVGLYTGSGGGWIIIVRAQSHMKNDNEVLMHGLQYLVWFTIWTLCFLLL